MSIRKSALPAVSAPRCGQAQIFSYYTEVCPAGAAKLGQKLCTKEGPIVYPKQVLPDETKWGSEMWNENYRDDNPSANCYDTGTAPCKSNCPAHIAVQGYIRMAAEGRYMDALKLIKKENPFPAVCGHICDGLTFQTAQPDIFVGGDVATGPKFAIDAIAAALPELRGAQDAAMVGYRLKNTVSPFGTVTRGVCATENGLLRKVHETYKIQLCPDGTIRDTSGAGAGVALDPEALVSMNMWGYHPAMLDVMAQYFDAFVRDLAPGDEKRECLLPVMMDALTAQGRVRTRVLQTNERWFGLTYQDDKPGVVAALRALHADGTYPPALWK